MAQQNSVTIQKPRADERPLWDLLEAAIGTYGLLVAHNLKLFPFLAEQPRTLQEVCDALKIVSRPADALLTLCVSAGLLRVQDGRYSLTSLAEDYLLEGSSTYFGGFLDLLIAIDSSGGLSVEAFKKAVLTNSCCNALMQIYSNIPVSLQKISGWWVTILRSIILLIFFVRQ